MKSSKIFTAHRILQDTNFKSGKVGFVGARFSIFCKSMSFTAAKKTGLIDFTEKVSRNFTEGNARKFTVSFAFCAHVDVTKYQKTLTFSFECAQIT